MKKLKAIIVPGNGDADPNGKWSPFIKRELQKIGIKVTNIKYPDPVLARSKYWLPFIKKIGADENTILIGHSSGAIASMRFVEKEKVFGSVLVGAYVSDLGVKEEKLSGYFNKPWNWQKIKTNQNWIIQFASKDDPFIPIRESRSVHKNLDTEYYEYSNRGHFGSQDGKTKFPEMVKAIKNRLKQ
jgi:predicted alpha/beta hydrolase family esterase